MQNIWKKRKFREINLFKFPMKIEKIIIRDWNGVCPYLIFFHSILFLRRILSRDDFQLSFLLFAQILFFVRDFWLFESGGHALLKAAFSVSSPILDITLLFSVQNAVTSKIDLANKQHNLIVHISTTRKRNNSNFHGFFLGSWEYEIWIRF